jgi:hypothetical protein
MAATIIWGEGHEGAMASSAATTHDSGESSYWCVLGGPGRPSELCGNRRVDPEAACVSLANLTNFPVTPTEITSAKFNPADTMPANGVPLPAHCQIDGIVNKRTSIDGYPYGDGFEVRLPAPADWNGRFMFQGGGGTEGSVPAATGTAGTLSPTLAHG